MHSFVISIVEIQDFGRLLLRAVNSIVVPPKRGSLSRTQCLIANDNSQAHDGFPGLYREHIVYLFIVGGCISDSHKKYCWLILKGESQWILEKISVIYFKINFR
jgi:hypothetical protein